MVGSCVTTMKMTNVGSCVNNIHSFLWLQYIRFESIHKPSIYIRKPFLHVYESCQKWNQIVIKSILKETCWPMVNEMMSGIKW